MKRDSLIRLDLYRLTDLTFAIIVEMPKLSQTKTNINVRLSVNRRDSSGMSWFVKPQLYPLCIRECGYRRN